MYQYPNENFFCPNCYYYGSSLLGQRFQPVNEVNPQFVPSYPCPQYYNSPLKFTMSEVNLMNEMRKLWEQHDVWTRATITSIAMDLPDVDLVTKRLLRNPVDFGNVLKYFYNDNIALKFSDLLKNHLVIAAELVKAAKASNKQDAADAEKRWYDNADELAVFLGRINPYWSQEEWKRMLHQHLALVKSEAVNILTKNYDAGIRVYDEIENQSLEMADMLARGIIKQFPNSFIE